MNKTQIADIDRTRVGPMLMKLFSHWRISTGDQISLLGLSKDNRAALNQYRNGQLLSKDRDKRERAGMLLGIHKSLRLLFPHSRELAYGWMTRANQGGLNNQVQHVTHQVRCCHGSCQEICRL